MTFFLSGLYTLPADKRMLYRPPQHPRGASAIGFLPRRWVHATIEQVGRAWLDGHEIGTHFNGHFCGSTGVSRWSPQDWNSEIGQAKGFVKSWRSNTGFTDLPPLPFDYDQELIGSRTPCLEGQANLMRSAAARRWRYDSFGTGRAHDTTPSARLNPRPQTGPRRHGVQRATGPPFSARNGPHGQGRTDRGERRLT